MNEAGSILLSRVNGTGATGAQVQPGGSQITVSVPGKDSATPGSPSAWPTLIDVIVVFLFTKPIVTLLAGTEFYGGGHKWSGLDPVRLGARAPRRSSARRTRRPGPGRAGEPGGTA
jgi:hypothetical protein